MRNRTSLWRGAFGASLAAALAFSVAAGGAYAQTMNSRYPPSAPNYVAPPPQVPYALDVMQNSVAEAPEPCGGDYGMLGKMEASRHDVTQVSPSGGPYCD